MAHRSKRYKEARGTIERTKEYPLDEAIGLLQGLPRAKFEETVEVVLKLGVDPKKSDQAVRGSVSLPKGTGQDVDVIAFAEGESAAAAKAAGAIEAGSDDLVAKIEGGWLGFDVAVATPDMMRKIAKLGRVLGPQGKMPSPKSGTVTDDVARAVSEFRAGKIEYRTDNTGNIHAPMGKMGFDAEDLKLNIQSFIDHIAGARPASVKGRFVQKVYVTSTMGPAIRLAV